MRTSRLLLVVMAAVFAACPGPDTDMDTEDELSVEALRRIDALSPELYRPQARAAVHSRDLLASAAPVPSRERLGELEGSLTHVPFRPRPKPPTTPVPARVLAKISPSEIATTFTLDASTGDCDLRALRGQGLIPEGLRVAGAAYVGQTRSGDAAFRVHLQRPTRLSQVKAALRPSRLRLSASSPQLAPATLVGSVLVDVPSNALDRSDGPCVVPFVQLRAGSHLHEVFEGVGVTSIRRVFRGLEKTSRERPRQFRVTTVRELLAAARRKFPARAARADPGVEIPDNLENWFLLRLKPKASLARAVDALERSPGIQSVATDLRVRKAQFAPQYANQWGLKNTGQNGGTPGEDINIEPAWADAAPSVGPVVVAVIDTGFKEDLDQLASRLWTNTAEMGGSPDVDDDCNGYIDDVHGMTAYDPWSITYSGDACDVHPGVGSTPFDSHGTSVAGVIAADSTVSHPSAISGAAGLQDVRLMNLVVGNCDLSSPLASGTAEIAESFLYIVAQGADIASISLGTSPARGYPVLLDEALQVPLAAGVVVAASAGNDGQRFQHDADQGALTVYPAGLRGVIAVGGATAQGQWWPQSNYGPGLDLVAPAENVRTITYTDPAQTVADAVDLDGTSFATPFVTGTAAIVLGKYDHVTEPYMRQWLRATARDITDPLGDGSNLVGHDQWTAAGMLDAGSATVSLADPSDQPINVSILVERLREGHRHPALLDAAAGTPDLGITVTTPPPCQAGGGPDLCLSQWRLEYGEGDAPSSWLPIAIDPGVTGSVIDIARTGTYYAKIDVAPGANYLNTDTLTNDTVYTLRLVAESNATPPREFVAEDRFVPVRARLTEPFDNVSLVGRWGWPKLKGFADIRTNAGYEIAFTQDDGTPIWTTATMSPALRYADPYWSGSTAASQWGLSASAFMELLGNDSKHGLVLTPPDGADPTSPPQGWVRFRLDVTTPTGATETDEVRLFLDNTHFDYEANWPQDTATDAWRTGHSQETLLAPDLGGTVGPRILVHSRNRFLCFNPNGTLEWSKVLHHTFIEDDVHGNSFDLPDFAVADVNNDGTREILLAGTTGTIGGGIVLQVHLLGHDGSSADDWPREFGPYEDYSIAQYIHKIHVADVAGDDAKEIVFYRRPIFYYGVAEDDIMPGTLHVVGLDGQDLWTKEYPREQRHLPLDTGDVDGDGKDEILIEPDVILDGDGSLLSGWDTPEHPDGRGQLVDLDLSSPTVEVLMYPARWSSSYDITVRNADGSALTGWPITIQSNATYETGDARPRAPVIVVDQVVAGGDPEVVICDDEIRVRGSNGSAVGLSGIPLMGRCKGLRVADTDADGTPDSFFVLVHRTNKDAPAGGRQGSFAEAYRFDGTRLAFGDARWPLVVEDETPWARYPRGAHWNGNITFGDLDQDGLLEAIHVLRLKRETCNHCDQGAAAHLNDTRIEVLDIQ